MTTKPFLRWAGGKTWLTKYICGFLPKDGFNNYHEPFLGGGSIYFFLKPKKAYLSDLNKDLIDTYNQVKINVESVISELKGFENNLLFYNSVRNEDYDNEAKQAAKFIYLNQTSFNGIYRVNLKGEYNVPFGFRDKNFFEPDKLRIASKALSKAKLTHSDFTKSIKNVKRNDLVFLDPPYTVTHNNNGFIKYNRKLFDMDSQHSLSEYIDEVKKKGAYYILTNAAHDKIREIFTKENDRIFPIDRISLIGGKNASRGNFAELIITNIPL